MSRLIFRLIAAAVLCCGAVLPCVAQNPAAPVQTLLILPFENHSKSPGLEWIGESFPEILAQRLSSPSMYIISREDRVYAFDRMGIPVSSRPTHATLYRIAEQMDCDYVVMGDYTFDGVTFRAHATALDMKQLRQSPALEASGPLLNLIDVQTDLAWQLLKSIKPDSTISREEMMRSASAVRLDSFENYVRGIVATTRQEKVRRFREAIRSNPQYTPAIFQLGKTYYSNREYDSAINWLSRIPQSESKAGEAYFLLGLAYYNQGQFERAEEAFKVTISKLPLTEVYNDLGATALRRGMRSALPLLEKTVEVDPHDPDYRFNLALALYRFGDRGTGGEEPSRVAGEVSDGYGSAAILRRNHRCGRPGNGESRRSSGFRKHGRGLQRDGCFNRQAAASAHQTELRRGLVQDAGAGDSELEQTNPGAGQRCANQLPLAARE